MPTAVYAYAFLKAAYSEGVRNPVDAVAPLVKRALMKFGTRDIDQLKIQQRIKSSIGLEMPLNVIRYTFPRLVTDGVLKLDNMIYKLVDANYIDETIVLLENESRAQYERIKAKINRFFIDNEVKGFNPDSFIEEWLDESCLSFLGGINPAFSAGTKDREINRLMYLIINSDDPKGEFLTDLTGVALGDSLYHAIKAITEYEASDDALVGVPTKMEAVEAYLDTRFVIRALGFGAEQFTHAARELLSLCRSTGCATRIFPHNVAEIQRVIRTVADLMASGRQIEGDIASYASEYGLTPGDLVDLASRIEEEIQALGIEVKEPPPLTTEMSIDERALEDQLKIDLRQATDEARITDVASLAAIYRLRRGEAKRYLEKCDAIFVTTNKGLSDSAVRYFQPLFKDAGQPNRVQMCMTDVVFSTRLWTKLPTSLDRIPRDQIIAHIMGYLRPSATLQGSFVQHLREFVSEGKLTEEVATKIRLSRFVQQALAIEFEAGKTKLTRKEFVSVAKSIIEKQKALQAKIRESIACEERAKAQGELDVAMQRLREIERTIIQRDGDIDELAREIEANATRIQTMVEASERVRYKVSRLAAWGIRIVAAICLIWVFDLVFSVTLILETVLVRFGALRAGQDLGSVRVWLNGTAAVFLTLFTLTGLSMAGARQWAERVVLRRIMDFVFK